ncbi:MAG: MFS transporter [Candidatus Planktophila sp.]|nr:MFS transporter [Candidatus Planktophila sp.]
MLFSALKNSNYRKFYIATLISTFGTFTQRVAQDWLTLDLTSSAKSLGLVVAAQFLPGVVFAIYGGVLADRYDQRRILFWLNFAGFLIATSTGILVATGHITFQILLISAFLLGIFTGIDGPVRQSYYVLLVGDKNLPNALSWNQINLNIGRLIGPVTAGLLIEHFGTSPGFIINGGTYLFATIFITTINVALYFPAHELEASENKVTLFDSLRYLRENRTVLIPIVAVCAIAMVGQDMQMTSTLMARKVFDVSPISFGLLVSILAVGAIAGSLAVARTSAEIDIAFLGRNVLYMALTWFLVASAPNYFTYAITLFFAGFFAMGINISGNMSIRKFVDPRHYGRIWGIYISLWVGALAIGGPLLGWISESISVRISIYFGAVVTLMIALIMHIYIKRTSPNAAKGSLSSN